VLRAVVLTKYRRVTDGQTDGQTDRQTDGIAVASTVLAMRALRRAVKNEAKHSEMGPVRQNPIQRTVLFMCVCIALCTIVAHNIAHSRPDNFPYYPPDNHHCSDNVYLRRIEETEER